MMCRSRMEQKAFRENCGCWKNTALTVTIAAEVIKTRLLVCDVTEMPCTGYTPGKVSSTLT